MAAEEAVDTVMADPEENKGDAAPATDAATGDEAQAASKEPEGPSAEERITTAEVEKEAGNALLKSGDFEGAVAKYAEGIGLVESLLEKDPSEVGDEEMQQRRTAVYIALCLNSAQACIKQSKWTDAADHANRVLAIDKENAKALFRRAVASMQFDTESRLEQARTDLARFVQLEPGNREARDRLQQVKERLKEAKQREKERFSQAMKGGLYEEAHKKLDRQKLEYEEEVKRREDAGEDAISWEDWQKKLKEKEDSDKKKEKEARETLAKEAAEKEELRLLSEENERRKGQDLEELSLEEWRNSQRKKDEVMKMDEADLDEEERKMLEETKSKGYYHGRLGTVLSDAAPKPQQVSASEPSSPDSPNRQKRGSEWNQAGTWEEKDVSDWAKERLTACLGAASVVGRSVKLASGEEVIVSSEVSKVKSISGDAQIVTVRKQPRFGYNFEAELGFKVRVKSENGDTEMRSAEADASDEGKVEASSQRFEGTLSLPELADFVQLQDLRFEAKWKGRSPPEHLQTVVLECIQDLKSSVREKVSSFLTEYKAL